MDSLEKNNTRMLVENPSNQIVGGSKWIFKMKESMLESSKPRFKARLVAKGFTQREGIYFNKIYSPVVKHSSIRVLLALIAQCDMKLEQIDVKTAFLHGNLGERILMARPERFVQKRDEDKAYLLKKSLYGLKQSPRQ